jgi:hypothetical protein
MADGIPPWLNIDPVAPVGRLLEGYRAGLSASEAQTAAAQRAQQMAFAQQQAAEASRIRQEQHQLDVQRFGLELRLKEQQAEQAAQEAAIQLEGQQGLQKELAQGVPIQQAFVKWAPKLLYKHPERLAQAIQAMTPPGTPQPGWTPSGQEYMINPRTGAPVFSRAGGTPVEGIARELKDEQGNPLGIKYIPGAHGAVKPLQEPLGKRPLTPGERGRLLMAQLFLVRGLLRDTEPSSPEGKKLVEQRDDLMRQLKELTDQALGKGTTPQGSVAGSDTGTDMDEEEANTETEQLMDWEE